MLARSRFNEHNKSSNLLGIVTWPVLGKQNRQAKKVYSIPSSGYYIREFMQTRRRQQRERHLKM